MKPCNHEWNSNGLQVCTDCGTFILLRFNCHRKCGKKYFGNWFLFRHFMVDDIDVLCTLCPYEPFPIRMINSDPVIATTMLCLGLGSFLFASMFSQWTNTMQYESGESVRKRACLSKQLPGYIQFHYNVKHFR